MGLVMVATPAELTSAITSARAGDEIVLADGTYPLTGVSCSATGTETQPIEEHAAARAARARVAAASPSVRP